MTKERREELLQHQSRYHDLPDPCWLCELLASDAIRAEQVAKLHRYLLDEHGDDCGNEECEIPALLRETAE